MKRNVLIGLGVLLTSATAGGAWVVSRPAEVAGVTTFTPSVEVQQVAADLPEVIDMQMGNPDAAVTVVEYASFTCPHCAAFHENVFGKLKTDYIDTGKINFIYREVYFDKYGLWAGMVARCNGPVKYFGLTDLIYTKQKDWLASRNEAGIVADLRKLGLQAGMSAEQIDECLNDGAKAQALVAEFQKNATEDEVSSTPTLIINGTKYQNMSYGELTAILDEQLGE